MTCIRIEATHVPYDDLKVVRHGARDRRGHGHLSAAMPPRGGPLAASCSGAGMGLPGSARARRGGQRRVEVFGSLREELA